LPQKCEHLFKYGHSEVTEDDPLSGGLATHIVLRANTATYRVPEQISNRVAALANCSTSTAAAVIRSAGSLKNRTVLIFGAGVLGLAATAMASTSLAAQTWVCDPVQANAERACSFGATSFAPADPQALREWVGQRTDGRGVDVAFELSGSLSATTQALECCRIGGKVILAGTASPVGTLQLDPETIVRRILTVQGAHNYHPSDLGMALDFLSGPGRAFPFEALFAGAYPLARVGEAFRAAERQPGLRIIVEPS
jgi:alcohol dehydrogenase